MPDGKIRIQGHSGILEASDLARGKDCTRDNQGSISRWLVAPFAVCERENKNGESFKTAALLVW